MVVKIYLNVVKVEFLDELVGKGRGGGIYMGYTKLLGEKK